MKKEFLISKVLYSQILIWLFCPVFICNAQNFNSKVKAILKVSGEENKILVIMGVAKNLTKKNKSLHYELSVITSNKNSDNSTKNTQSGYFTLKPYETKNLARTSVSIDKNHQTILLLLIYNKDNLLLGTARKVYPLETKKKKEDQASYKKPYEGLKLNGMVTERTKTRVGKNFYKLFYQKYRLSGSPGNKIIKIEEMISFGRTTKITVKVGQKTLFQFFARPRAEYLEKMAEISLRRVNRYFEELKKQKEYIQHY